MVVAVAGVETRGRENDHSDSTFIIEHVSNYGTNPSAVITSALYQGLRVRIAVAH